MRTGNCKGSSWKKVVNTNLKVKIADKYISQGYKVELVLILVKLNKSTYYKQKKNKGCPRKKYFRKNKGYSMNNKGNKISDELIKNYILKAQKGYERYYGYKKLKHYLFRKYGIIINYKKLYRLCSELKILKKKIRIYKTKKNVAINRKINGSNQLWEIDIKYGYIKYEKRHFMICEIIDIYDKAILQYHIGNTCKAKNITYLIKKAFFNRGCPKGLIIRTDNGSQFKSKLFEQTCSFLNIHHERIPNATPNKVAHIEAFHSILERECLQYCNFWSLQQAYKEIVNFVSYYNSERIHGSLDYLTPMEYYELQKSDAFVKKVVNL